ncbi:integrin alpha FG-GAP repeat-containing protein 2 [Mortierella polycephala]|uniref:Integrin alpha FG-GAP repeat-containing protein 2 n=1 Tax=Mortierella polycephala TaxID=41804 RepID=A0A9P6UAR0_9FUNG|nr:integrin alpha FG-GAP repeat-containing protein 2 [Mortierella polycephala]
MPTARHVSLVQKLRWHVNGNISPTAFAIGDIDGQGDNAFVIGNLAGTLFIFKGNHPEGQPWLTCKELGTITAVAIGDIRNWGKNSIVVLSAEGLCHIFDIAGLDDESGHILSADNSIPLTGSNRNGNPSSIYSSTPGQGSYQQLPLQNSNYQGQSVSPQYSNIPATPSIRPQQQYTSNSTPSNSHPSSIHGGNGGARRGSEAISSSEASIRTATALANLIGTPTPSSSAGSIHGASSGSRHTRSFGGNSTANSPTGTPVLRPQQLPSNNASAQSSKDHSGKKTASNARYDAPGKPHVRHVGGRRVIERPNLTLPVPVNINRAHIADIDGDGLNEIVLARTDRILHSYALQTDKAASPTAGSQPNNQTLNLVKLLSRTSSVSTLDSSGLLSPSDDRRETVIHYPPLSSKGRSYYGGSNAAMLSAGLSQGNPEVQEVNSNNDSSCLVLVEKKRWALDGQIHCLSVTKDIHTGMPILLVAQPGLKFVMVDHTGNISEPITQVQRNSKSTCNLAGPDTPTRGAGTGDVATDILCGTHYVNGEKKDIIGLMSMDGAFALHDLESNTVKVHDLDSTHKIFGFSKLNFGKDYMETRVQESRRTRESYRRSSSCNADEINHDVLDDDGDERDDMGSEDGDGCGHRSSHARWTRRSGSPSLLISEPYGSRFQKDDIFVGCSWSGITFFIDQEFNTTQYDFDARVCAFGAGQYAVTPGRNEPCLFYVDFEDNIYVYYNLYIQTKPVIQFQDIVKSDMSLIQKDEGIHKKGMRREAAQQGKNQNGCEDGAISGSVDVNNRTVSSWTDHDIKSFIHDSLYNVNRYDDEYQRLRRLADIERAKRAAFFEEKSMKERRRQDAERITSADAGTSSDPTDTPEPSTFMDPRMRRPPHVLTLDTTGDGDGVMRTRLQRGRHLTSSQYTRSRQDAAYADNEHHHSPVSPRYPASPTSTYTNTGYLERRRSSLLIKDVLAHYEGKVTPPLKSPTSPSVPSNQSSKGHKAMTYASAVSASTLPGILKRFSIKDLGNGKRLSRSSSTGSGSSSSGSGNSQNTITQGRVPLGGSVLNKGKALETRAGKALRANRPLGAPRNRHLGVMTRKSSTRSRLSLQQDREDETEEGEDDVEQGPSDDGIGENDDESILEFEGSSRRSVGDDEDQQAPEEEEEMAGDEYFSRERGNEEQGEDDTPGVYTPSTISPIPSPGRFYGNQSGNVAEPSPSLDGSAFILAKSLLSPSNRSILSGSSAATSNAGAVGKSSRHADSDHGHGAPSSSISRGHMRQRSGHGLLDVGLGLLPTREITTTSGINSGPNSAGHCSNQDGRRSRAESVLSTGSDIGGVVVPDITLLASSFPNQSSIPLSTSEPLPQGTIMSDDDEMDIAPSNDTDLNSVTTGIRRAPRRSATAGSQEEFHGAGPAFDMTSGKSNSQQSTRHSVDGKSADVKLMPAPLPRSSQHHQRQQQEQQGSSGTGLSSKDGRLSSAGHIAFLSGTRSSNSGGASGGGENDGHSLHNGAEGFGRGLAGKSSSTTSSANASDIGSGPSSPLTGNVMSVSAILSNPSTNGNKGFGVLSIPVASPSASIASVQNQYFAQSHYPLQSAHQHLASSLYSKAIHPQDLVGVLEDDRVSIRSRTSTYRGADENNDITSLLTAGASTVAGGSSMDCGSTYDEHGIHGMSTTPSSTSHLASNSLIRRLEELQMQDHNLGRLKEDRTKSMVGTQPRPSALSRANSGASIQSAVSHRTPSQPLTSHSSLSGSSNHPSASGSGPASGSGKSPWDDDQESTKRLKYRLGMGEGL